MMDIPVTFEHGGKTYKGELVQVWGLESASKLYHLIVDHVFLGQLALAERGWEFTSKTPGLEKLTDYFTQAVLDQSS